ncbi:MAG TPA: methylenetetrahydrofolate reductase [NAD(P)H] [Planctomycetia bacterium]|nr:methylenetetrahydrofolate reductase [NAD(P)H] [Planctomycetia bacterium]
MRIGDLYRGPKPDLSFEVFPPKTPQGLAPMYAVVAELIRYRPGFISVTYGAGGSTRDQTLDIAAEVAAKHKVPATAHLTCVGSTVEELRGWLGQAVERGVTNIMALRGDPPQGQTSFKAVDGGLKYANELVALIKSEFPKLGIGVAGYPETHQEATNSEDDLRRLADKVAAGGDAVFTQLFYDNDDFFRFRDKCVALGIKKPIVPGLLPVLSLNQVKRITTLCKACLPKSLLTNLEACGDDAEKQISAGVEHAREQTRGLLAGGVPGIHYYVLNRADTIHRILEGQV